MKRPLLSLFLVGSAVVLAAAFAASGCGVADYAFSQCQPDPLLPDEKSCPPDAGPDTGTGEAGPPSAIDSCPGGCAPHPDAEDGAKWAFPPVVLWRGPNDENIIPKCSDTLNKYMQWLVFDDLEAPPASCEACECEVPTGGECTGVPDEMQIRAGLFCDANAPVLPFDGPSAWDGVCTDVNALPSGVMCPEGSSTPCAQSVWTSPLPRPTGESCAPKKSKPEATVQAHWKTAGVACLASANPCGCDDQGDWRVAEIPLDSEVCTYREGKHEDCPTNYNGWRYWMYQDTLEDTRGCSDCECGEPEGSGCLASLRVYDDAVCGSEFLKLPLGSMAEACGNVIPPGRALGSKAITDRSYLPGTCKAKGGEPIGEVNAPKLITFCCLPPFWQTK